MPAAVTESQSTDKPQDRNEQMWKVLKAHILRERARKKQEREAEVEEERLRKEREAREQQDVMTLGETREQITQLESKLTQLKEEKHQLFLQLKKVLNEDDNRRRQLFKDQNEMMTIQTIPSGLMHQQLYISPNVARSAPVNQLQTNFKPPAKRPRSPSPQPMVSVSMYHQGYGYKPSPVGSSPYQGSPQKNPQYSGQPSAFYPVPPQELSIYYPTMGPREPARNMYDAAPRPPQSFHLEPKLNEHYALRTISSPGHVIHGGSIPINPPQPPTKTGSITAGYPVRSQTQYQPPPSPASLYTAQSRPIYQSPGTPMNYPSRE